MHSERLFLSLFLCATAMSAVATKAPVRQVTDPGAIVTRQQIAPAGVQSVFDGRVYGVTFGKNAAEIWALTETQLVCMDWRANRVIATIPLAANPTRQPRHAADDPEVNASLPVGGKPGIQGIAFDAQADRVLFTAAGSGDVRLLTSELAANHGKPKLVVGKLGAQVTGAIALSKTPNSEGNRLAVVPILARNVAAVVDLSGGKLLGSVPTGIAPIGVAMNASGTIAYVSNWGGRLPVDGDLSAPAGLAASADRVVIDERGIASTGTLTKIDLIARISVATVPVGLHPTALAWDEASAHLYVANGNSDSISVVDTAADKEVSKIQLRPFSAAVPGTAPTALALSPDGAILYAACGGLNAIAVVDTKSGSLRGLIPTAWYPIHLSLSPDGRHLAVATLLGVGSGYQGEPSKRHVKAYRGSVSVLPVPDEAQLASYTTVVAENNRLPWHGSTPLDGIPSDRSAKSDVHRPRGKGPAATPRALPMRSGEPSLIEHVVYIIKENRTYDQVFGDLPKGNGDPSLVLFGEDVTPNHHRLADQFVLLDNFYASGGNSGDGHQWITQSNETDYAMWPGWAGRSYPFDGTDPIAYASGGFLWDYALKAGKTVRVFGEFAPRVTRKKGDLGRPELLARWKAGDSFDGRWHTRSPIPPLDRLLMRSFPGYSTAIPDVVRARLFITELRKWVHDGSMPNLVFLQLPSDHTNGTSPGSHSPKAMVADNDLALGQVVESLSHSPFWKKMLVLVVEDDAQNGVDHVDGHRTVALAISPYIRRGHVDSTFYAHPSLSKTIELVLGLPTLSLFDLIANDLRSSFTDEPDFTPYKAEIPRQVLDEVNPPAEKLKGAARQDAEASARMRFDAPDAAPTEQLNRIVWHNIRGRDIPYPPVRQAVFAPRSNDLDDSER